MNNALKVICLALATIVSTTECRAQANNEQKYILPFFKTAKTVSVSVQDSVKDGCWNGPNNAKTAFEKRLLTNGIAVKDVGDIHVVLRGHGFASTSGSGRRRESCVVHFSIQLQYFTPVAGPNSGPTIFSTILIDEDATLFINNNALDQEIEGITRNWADRFIVRWLKARVK